MWKHGHSGYMHHHCRCQICKDARNAYGRRQKRAERQTARYKAYQDAYIASYRERNRDELLAYAMEYRRNNRAEYLVKEQSPRGKANKREREQRRRALKLGQFIEDVDPFILYQAWGGICGICKEFVREDEFHIDHRIPISRGGGHGYVNCQPAHQSCNSRKHAKL